MIKVLLSGAAGRMGSFVAECISSKEGIEIIAGVDKMQRLLSFPLYSDFREI